METGVYVDILLAINYIINLLLILCAAKLAGRKPARRRIVAAALFGSASSLAIFLPFMGFWLASFVKLSVSAGMMLIAFKPLSARIYLKELFIFFSVSFIFAGAALALWIALKPNCMIYYNGVAYFDISAVTLIATSVAAYIITGIFHRISRLGRIRRDAYRVHIYFMGAAAVVDGLLDTGNSLREPFSGIPVIICRFEDVKRLLPQETAECVLNNDYLKGRTGEVALRGIPYSDVGGSGMLPAFRADKLELFREGEKITVENAYVGVSLKPVGDGSYGAILNPDLAGMAVNI